jgi:hypothetical protein
VAFWERKGEQKHGFGIAIKALSALIWTDIVVFALLACKIPHVFTASLN